MIMINKSHRYPRFTLMNQDIPLAEIDDEEGIIQVIDKNQAFLPYGLQKNNLRFRDFERWAANRALVLSRSNAKKILNVCHLDQTDRYETAKACRLLMVDDCFWIREQENEKWEQFDLKKNSLSKAISQLALNGEYITISGDIFSAELTTHGAHAKCWQRDKELYLYKKSGNYFESEKELLVSEILECLDIPHISYYPTQNPSVCKCKCMVDDDKYRLNYGEFEEYCRNHNQNAVQRVKEINPVLFYQMNVIDYLIANTDRHNGNWGFFVDAKTNAITDLHPLYDHNNAFDPCFNDKVGSIVMEGYSMIDAAIYAQDIIHLNLEPAKEIPKSRFELLQIDYNAFLTRLNTIQYGRKNNIKQSETYSVADIVLDGYINEIDTYQKLTVYLNENQPALAKDRLSIEEYIEKNIPDLYKEKIREYYSMQAEEDYELE